MNVGATIKAFRLLNSMDQKELADKLHVSNKTISSWESNRTQPKMEMIEEMCKVFNCKKSDFLSDGPDSHSIILSNDEFDLILKYRAADAPIRDSINQLLSYSKLINERIPDHLKIKGGNVDESKS